MTKKKLILHVGFPRTATTSIQDTLSRNRNLLEEQGFCYPKIVRSSFYHDMPHGEVFLSLFSERPEKVHLNIKRGGNIASINAMYHEQFEELLALEDCKILISAEHIAGQQPQFFEKIESAIQKYNWSIEVIAVVRHPLSNTCQYLL